MSGEIKVKRGPGRPPGKKKVISVLKKSTDDTAWDDLSMRRKRSAPTRLVESNTGKEKDLNQFRHTEGDVTHKMAKLSSIQPEIPVLKRPRGRPPLSAGRGRTAPRSGRVLSKKSTAYSTYYGTSRPNSYPSYSPFEGKQSEISSIITKKVISWLITHDPQSISEISRGVSSSLANSTSDMSSLPITGEHIQAILDILVVLGLISSVIAINLNNNQSTGAEGTSSKTSYGGSSKNAQRLYCMKGFVKGSQEDVQFDYSTILEDMERKRREIAETEKRIERLQSLSSNMYQLTPEERISSLQTTLQDFIHLKCPHPGTDNSPVNQQTEEPLSLPNFDVNAKSTELGDIDNKNNSIITNKNENKLFLSALDLIESWNVTNANSKS